MADPYRPAAVRRRRAVAIIFGAGIVAMVVILISNGTTESTKPGSSQAPGGKKKKSPPPAPGVSIKAKDLYPEFNPNEHHYVARCPKGSVKTRVHTGPGSTVQIGTGKPRSGKFQTKVPVFSGASFEITTKKGSDVRTYQVRCLPYDFPQWDYQRLRPSEPGMFVVSVSPSRLTRPWVIIFDTNGVPRWWFSPPTATLWAQMLPDGTMEWPRAFGDGFGQDPRNADEIRDLSGKLIKLVRTDGTVTDGHEYEPLPNGDVYIDAYVRHRADLSKFGGPAKTWVVVAEIQEQDPSGKVIWSWNSWKHISLAETGRWWKYELVNPHPGPNGTDVFDAVHPNSIEPWGDNMIILSTRHTDAIFGIQKSTGKIVWKMGGTKTPVSLKLIGGPYPANKLFGGQHDVRMNKGNILSIHDNGTHRGRPVRIAFYKIDLKNRTATFQGQLTDPEVNHASHCCGSARQLPGGGWIVTWGDSKVVTGFDANDKIAWRMRIATSTYRAVPVPPGAVTDAELNQGLDDQERPP